MSRTFARLTVAFLVSIAVALGFSQAQQRGERTPGEIIKAFSEKETEFYEAWKQYTYRQTSEIRVLSVNGYRRNERLTLVSEVVFNDDGTREVRLLQRKGGLESVAWTQEDTERINKILPFALTASDLRLYDLKYEGRERVDELDCYVFTVRPKSTRGNRLYFQGKIWVDDQDLQVVRTIGKPEPQSRRNRFPEFETIRQVIDEKYWFPVWTHSDDVLNFDNLRVRIEETITYSEYKRFGSKATIEFGPPKPE